MHLRLTRVVTDSLSRLSSSLSIPVSTLGTAIVRVGVLQAQPHGPVSEDGVTKIGLPGRLETVGGTAEGDKEVEVWAVNNAEALRVGAT